MKTGKVARPQVITERFIRTVCARLEENKRVRRKLPIWGRVHIDRQLPFLCVYRRPVHGDDAGTERFATGEAAYLTASGAGRLQAGLAGLVQGIAQTMTAQFGAFLIVELWSGEVGESDPPGGQDSHKPGFRIIAPKDGDIGVLISTFDDVLSRITLRKQPAETHIRLTPRCCPRQYAPILSADVARKLGCRTLGLEIRPVYRGAGGVLYPLILRELRRGLSQALRQTFYKFTRTQTTQRPKHYQVLGRRAVVKAVWEVDRQLAEVSDSFEFLLQVTPANAEQAWRKFERKRFNVAPVFRYRPLPADPVVLKRRLYGTPIERVEDPALSLLLRQKQDELDRQITMLTDVNTCRFVHGSLQLYGGVEDDLKRLADQVLYRLPPRTREDSRSGHLDAAAFAERAKEEIAYYRQRWPEVDAGVEVREDLASGLMVSRGSLLIGQHARIPVSRVEPLLQHEVGTHVLTYYNGRAQPFRQLYSGLAGYEAFQEGLAVLAEYLVGGLSRPRMRLLAARVLATRHMIDGATFVDAYRKLNGLYGFDRLTAFTVAMRIYRGGGLTKDAVYLRGLCQMLEYLGSDGEFGPLLVGKIASDHIPIVRELQWRKVLRNPPLSPRYLEMPAARSRLQEVRKGMTVLDLINGRRR
ncbi:MAG: flavohemoglobin expression-modulating QEGLA motif protein [Planctomycetes bacterium]|nr:flavohemoglobin expression-modulating QEGLA motif protein [Planctomycetota bacterium]